MTVSDGVGRRLADAAEAAGYETRSYSGRAMYGKECLAITVNRGVSLWTVALALSAEYEDPSELARLSVREDAMGLGAVIYFPDVPFPGGSDGDDSEE